jgi:hypothetical protein
MTRPPKSSHTRRLARCPIVIVVLLIVGGMCVAPTNFPARAEGARSIGSYGWPVKPFDRQHAIRGYFGDPRTIFIGRPTFGNLLHGAGAFGFHFGIDICAPDGTAVYAVRSGTAELLPHETVQVSSGDSSAFQYTHVVPAVHSGQYVNAYQTVIGHVVRAAHHVHLTELVDGEPVNPLGRDHLRPYVDHTRPFISSISFRKDPAGREVAPEFVRGRIHLIAEAFDLPAMPVTSPSRWRRLPVAPAMLKWRLERAESGARVIPNQTAFDVRVKLPTDEAFWNFYARGSHQNMLQFETHRFWRQPGRYLYRLTRAAFDTRRVPNGVYRLIVMASDSRGNSSTTIQVFTVLN